jgi:hypothetical protein
MITNMFRIRKKIIIAQQEAGFILIASLAMLVVLAGVVLICIYPRAYESDQAPRHRETLRRIKMAEQGIFGRLADQAGGVYSAGGGYISDLGSKMIVEKYDDIADVVYSRTRLARAMDFWVYRRNSSICVLNDLNNTSYEVDEGADDIYRYNPATGFWAGYRGKRYVTRPVGEERSREERKIVVPNIGTVYYAPLFSTGGSGFSLDLKGQYRKDAFYLVTSGLTDYSGPDSTLQLINLEFKITLEHSRYYNPVERLVVRVNDRRQVRTLLKARLVYAKQPDPENIVSVNSDSDTLMKLYLPKLSTRTVTEEPYKTETMDNITSFIFRWDPANTEIGRYSPRVDIGHTFEIGLKKFILLENDIPVFSCGITIPPVREYQCMGVQGDPAHNNGCQQKLSDQYVVEVDYDG